MNADESLPSRSIMVLLVDFTGNKVKCNSIRFPIMASFLLSKQHSTLLTNSSVIINQNECI